MIKSGLVCCVLLFLFLATAAQGQEMMYGYVKSLEGDEGIPFVSVVNMRTGHQVQSDQQGYFAMPAQSGDQLRLERLGIEPVVLRVSPKMLGTPQRVYVAYSRTELGEVSVRSISRYQQDSLYRDSLYRPVLARKKEKAEVVGSPLGLVITNPISSWMQYIAPKTKQKWRFQQNFARWEAEKFIQTIYTPDRVTELTGLSGDSCAYFMNAYPMSLQMARTASQVEQNTWIRASFADWREKGSLLLIK